MDRPQTVSQPKLLFQKRPQSMHLKKVKSSLGVLQKSYTGASKEDLLEQNIVLKQSLNKTKAESVKLKTKLYALTRKKESVTDNSQSLVHSLKAQLKQAKDETDRVKRDLEAAKQSTRASRIHELETQNQVFSEECARLRKLLQEAMLQLSSCLGPVDIKEKYLAQCLQVKTLKKQNKELLKAMDLPESTGKKLSVMGRLKLGLREVRDENLKLRERVDYLEGMLTHYKNVVKEFEHLEAVPVSTILAEIYCAGNIRQMTLTEMWNSLAAGKERMKANELKRAVKDTFGVLLNNSQVKMLLVELDASDFVERMKFTEVMRSASADCVNYAQVKSDLMHLSLRLQIRRVSLQEFAEDVQYINKPLNKAELRGYFTRDPINLSERQADTIAAFLFGVQSSLSSKEVAKRLLLCMKSWHVISEREEKELKAQIQEFMAQKCEEFLKLAIEMDSDKSGVIPFDDFQGIMEDLNFEMSEKLTEFCKALFYADREELDEVPYLGFLKAYPPEGSAV